MSNVLDNIKLIAKRRGITISSLADQVGISEPTIYGWKTQSPRANTLLQVAEILNVSIDFLMTGELKELTNADLFDILSQPGEILTFDGKPIDDETVKMVIRLLRGTDLDG